MKKIFMPYFALFIMLVGCDDLFDPALENVLDKNQMYNQVSFAQGYLLNGYTRIPGLSFNDVATDDAVTNDKNNAFLKMATGQWTANNNPTEQWTNSHAAIQYLNIALAEVDNIRWAEDEKASLMFRDRIKGEAYGLRGFFMYLVLRSHSGWTSSGQLLGVPILTDVQDINTNFNKPRATLQECLDQLFEDLSRAEELLPLDYNNITSSENIPAKYRDLGITPEEYSRVFGEYYRLRMTARIAKGIRAQAALLGASPAFNEGTNVSWEDAANASADVLNLIGGVNGLASNGWTWYDNQSEINNLAAGVNPPEILWRGGAANSRSLEEENYPPTLYGNGRINPTQNLVEAFPMANGYPILSSESGYNANAPYQNRDPRLQKYIVFNGSSVGPSNRTVRTDVSGGTTDGIDRIETSTRTGYYLRKHLRSDVNLDPNTANEQKHYTAFIRYTELFLNYAEAANEAWGPDGTGGHGYSAKDVVRAIRARAGVGNSNGDPYLSSIQTKEQMRELIRNERRLELCFEGHRFWDLRRWNLQLDESAVGVRITGNNYTPTLVENRLYAEHMTYGPVPYSEIIKWSELIQNQGW